jgi:hypothetical protein
MTAYARHTNFGTGGLANSIRAFFVFPCGISDLFSPFALGQRLTPKTAPVSMVGRGEAC